jgi:hypothetical protein
MRHRPCNLAHHQSLLSNICLALFWRAISGRFIRQLRPNSVRPEKQPDRNTAGFQPVKPNMTQLESQTTRRQFGWGSLSTSQISWDMRLLMVNSCIKVRLDSQAYKYRIQGIESVEQMCDAKDDLVKTSNFNLRKRETLIHLHKEHKTRTNLIY